MPSTGPAHVKVDTTECPHCHRNFAKDRVETHAAICAKQKGPRKIYDISKKRVQGTDAEELVKAGMK